MKRRVTTRMSWIHSNPMDTAVEARRNGSIQPEHYTITFLSVISHGGGKGDLNISLSHPFEETRNTSLTKRSEEKVIEDIALSLYNSNERFQSLGLDWMGREGRHSGVMLTFHANPKESFCEEALRVVLLVFKAFGVKLPEYQTTLFHLVQDHEVWIGGKWKSYDTFLSEKFWEENEPKSVAQ